VPVAVDTAGNLKSDFLLNQSKGEGGYSGVQKFGSNLAVTNASFAAVTAEGGVYPFPTTAQTLRVKAGGNANDTAAGSGARTVTIYGLDGNLAQINETVTLAGALASAATTATFFRVYRAFVTTCGTYGGNNTGNIDIENTTSSQVLARIAAGLGQTQMAVYTIPAGYTGYMRQMWANISDGNTADVRAWYRLSSTTVAAPYSSARLFGNITDAAGDHTYRPQFLSPFAAGTDIWFDAKRITGAGNAQINVMFDIILVPTT
jgi:hypothetical protein